MEPCWAGMLFSCRAVEVMPDQTAVSPTKGDIDSNPFREQIFFIKISQGHRQIDIINPI